MIRLRQGALHACIAPLGGELQSLWRSGEEFLWQGDPAVWAQRAPWLFPFVGRLRGGGFTHRGRRYALPLHGFAAQLRFEVVEQQADAVWLEARDDANTRALYPFAFRLRIGFALHGERELAIGLMLDNFGDEPLPFGLGAHPGFTLPPGEWCLRFEQAETDAVWRLDGALLAGVPEPFAWSAPGRLDLTAETFARDALILKQPRSRWVALCRPDGAERLRLQVHGAGMEHLGLWARPGARYVCIEPWWGHDDDAEAPEALLDKPQLQRLPPGDTWARALSIQLAE